MSGVTAKVVSTIWRGLKFSGRVAVEGLAHIGFAYTVMPPHYFATIRKGKQAQAEAEWDDEIVYQSHPERMIDLPMTPAEKLLWAQITGPGPKERERHAD